MNIMNWNVRFRMNIDEKICYVLGTQIEDDDKKTNKKKIWIYKNKKDIKWQRHGITTQSPQK
jgi:hypothetical protein